MNRKHLFILLVLFLMMFLVNSTKPLPQMFLTADRCISCHNQLISPRGEDVSIGSNWRSSMMANSARDPYWQAAIRRETLVHPSASQAIQHECSACHMPMTRYTAKAMGKKGEVFRHLPVHFKQDDDNLMAADGVSCTMCHQIEKSNLGKKESFTAGFIVDTKTPLGKRRIFGPFEVDEGRTHLMQSSAQFVPQQALHVQSSEFCATCHTLYTHALNGKGEVIGELPEQVPYLEWKHSSYPGEKSCQDCHMPELEGKMKISGVLGLEHDHFHRHSFKGGNFLMPRILNRYRSELGVKAMPVELVSTSQQAADNLKNATAELNISSVAVEDGRLNINIQVRNLAGHKLPTAYPSRRVWIHLVVKDGAGRTIFQSGRFNADGSIAGNDNDRDMHRFEPHHQIINDPDMVQIYEPIMGDINGRVTTVLLSGVRYLKDNRLLPEGFDKLTADKDCAVFGRAAEDDDFTAAGDRIIYQIPVGDGNGPFQVTAELWYQPIGFRWAQNLRDKDSEEGRRFINFYEAFAGASAKLLCRVKSKTDQ